MKPTGERHFFSTDFTVIVTSPPPWAPAEVACILASRPGISVVDRFVSFPPGMERGAQLLASDVTVTVFVQAAWQYESN